MSPRYSAPDVALPQKEKANAQYAAKRFSEAEAIYTTMINQISATAEPVFIRIIFCNRAACFIELARYQDAIDDLKKVLGYNLNLPDTDSITTKAHFRLAHCYNELGRYGDAHRESDTYRGRGSIAQSVAEMNLRNSIFQGLAISTRTPGSEERLLLFKAKILGCDVPFVRYDTIPKALCVSRPPEIEVKGFLAQMINKYNADILRQQTWKCSVCGALATALVHTPMSYFHLAEPQIHDIAQPVCRSGGSCEITAREIVGEQLVSKFGRFES